MRLLTLRLAGYVTPFSVLLVTAAFYLLPVSEAEAYEKYLDCKQCHGSYRGGSYTSLSDGSRWSDNLHNVHRNDMLDGDCDVCHTSGGKGTVYMDRSVGGTGLAAIGCVGCHGREEDMGHDSASAGRGAGLRQHHTNAGETDCLACHSDADPGQYTPVGEHVLPDYYSNSGTGYPSMPADSCNPGGKENFAGGIEGLDNDGDGSYDTNDSDCSTTATFTVGGTVSGLVGPGLELQNNGSDTLTVDLDGPFTFATEVEEGTNYSVSVSTQPDGQICSVSNGSGTVSDGNITDVLVACATTFKINAGLNDAWYNPATDGQGILITVFPETGLMFVAWFTYEVERPAEDIQAIIGDPGHRWLTAQGPYAGDTASLSIYITEGGVFDAVEPAPINDRIADGTMQIEFADCTEGLVTYQLTSPGISGEIPIQRITDDNVALCEALANQSGAAESQSSKESTEQH